MTVTISQVKRYMQSIQAYHVDPATGETNCTTLAEATAHHFDHDEWLDDENHFVWELALEVAELV